MPSRKLGSQYIGALLLEDAAFCSYIYLLLKQNIGRFISEIGDLDVSDSL